MKPGRWSLDDPRHPSRWLESGTTNPAKGDLPETIELHPQPATTHRIVIETASPETADLILQVLKRFGDANVTLDKATAEDE